MYPVDLHMHTVASTHAYSTLHDYIAEAKRKGIKLFAITDHGPDMADAPHYWHFVNMRIWPRLVDGVGILRGIESNIKNIEGEIDCSGPMLTSLDLIIAASAIAGISTGNFGLPGWLIICTLPLAIAAAVRDAGGGVALGSDSHTAFTLGEFTECRKILDAVDFPEERILNVSPRRLLNFLESRGMPAIPEFADL